MMQQTAALFARTVALSARAVVACAAQKLKAGRYSAISPIIRYQHHVQETQDNYHSSIDVLRRYVVDC